MLQVSQKTNRAKFIIFTVSMGKVIFIIPMQSSATGTLLLPILKGKCLRLVVTHPITKRLKYLISTPIHGQQKVNFPFAQIGKKIYDHLVYRIINFNENTDRSVQENILAFIDMRL